MRVRREPCWGERRLPVRNQTTFLVPDGVSVSEFIRTIRGRQLNTDQAPPTPTPPSVNRCAARRACLMPISELGESEEEEGRLLRMAYASQGTFGMKLV